MENKRLKSEVKGNTKDLEDQYNFICSLEEDLSRLEQYGRRENIGLSGIPAHVTDSELENEVLDILHTIGLPHLDHYGIAACHRVGKKDKNGNRNTIVRFVNRKDAISALKNKRNLYLCRDLGYHRLFIMENLCPRYKSIFEEMIDLKKKGEIHNVWTFNGHVHYKLTDSDQEKGKKITRDSDIENFSLQETAVLWKVTSSVKETVRPHNKNNNYLGENWIRYDLDQ